MLSWCVTDPNSAVTFTWDSNIFVPTVTVEVAVPVESSTWGTIKSLY